MQGYYSWININVKKTKQKNPMFCLFFYLLGKPFIPTDLDPADLSDVIQWDLVTIVLLTTRYLSLLIKENTSLITDQQSGSANY